jgi:hypothetical protein
MHIMSRHLLAACCKGRVHRDERGFAILARLPNRSNMQETERQEWTMNWNAMTKAWLRARALLGSKARAFYRAISEEWLAKFRLKAHYTNRRSLP